MLLKDFINDGTSSLQALYPTEEARKIVLMLCEALLGVQSYTHIIEPRTEVPSGREEVLAEALSRLLAAEPVQYVTGAASFCGYDFRVTPDVLIPRPETECLVREACAAVEALQRMRIPAGKSGEALQVLDLCTGSGCIAWTMALSLPGARVTGVDVSEEALAVARRQDFGRLLRKAGARAPEFIRLDVLEPSAIFEGRSFDLILSNPPYIPASQRALMRPNVVDHEPSLALFVPDADPLLFYRAIAAWAKRCLAPWGRGFVEIHEDFGPQTRDVFLQNGFDRASLVKDFYGKNRIVAF
ncbi:MAG: peptide chain release factor N(5)-glutamine methyltransferase [Bacteroidales bacterium]|nr:peptide chain release factor N(5)-glutamine methyltransferase [Bacteroidales bacterium]